VHRLAARTSKEFCRKSRFFAAFASLLRENAAEVLKKFEWLKIIAVATVKVIIVIVKSRFTFLLEAVLKLRNGTRIRRIRRIFANI
jgi:hypothetical protein